MVCAFKDGGGEEIDGRREKTIYIYTTIGGLSAKSCPHDSDRGVDFDAPTCCQSATFGQLFAFYCPLFFTIFFLNNAVYRHICDVYAAVFAFDVATALRQINP